MAVSIEPFGKRLARLRQARGHSQYTLADELGISQRKVAYYETQTERPPPRLLPRIAEILGVSAMNSSASSRSTTEKASGTRQIEKRARSNRRARQPGGGA